MISINYKDPRPIYEQVKDGLRKLIISGTVKPDEKLPSVREMAAAGSVNPNTIQRAYRELEAEGYIYSVAGKGSFASDRNEADSARRDTLLKVFRDTVTELVYLGLGRDELCRIIAEGGSNL